MSQFYQDVLEPLLNGPVESLVEFLRVKVMLKRTVMCPECRVDMVCKPYTRNKDGITFRCYNKECNGYTKYHSIRAESFFSEFNVPLSSILKVCCKWFSCHSQVQIGSELRLNRKVIMKIIDRWHKLCANFVPQNLVRLGGDGIVVQIDENLFRHKQKYHDVSFTSAKISLHIVEDRRASTLLPIIEQMCIPGSINHSDQWRAYRSINFRGK